MATELGARVDASGDRVPTPKQQRGVFDVARIERKIDRQGNDIADTLYYITQSVDDELRKAR